MSVILSNKSGNDIREEWCVVRTKGLQKSFFAPMTYNEIYDNRYELDKVSYEMPLLGLNFYLKSDFQYLETVDLEKYKNILVLEENNFIFKDWKNKTGNEIKTKFFSNGIEIEDGRWQGGYDRTNQPNLDFEIPKPYSKFLNNFIMTDISERNISFWYRYYIPYYEKFIQKKENICFIQKRSGNIGYIKERLRVLGYATFEEKFYNVPYSEYYSNFGKTKYVINLDNNNSAGQVIAESVLMDSVVFSRPHKLFSKMLLPKFCMVQDADEALSKIELLEKNNVLFDEILKEIKQSKIKLSFTYRHHKI